MPVSRELSLTYAGLTFGGSTARQIDGYTIVEKDYTTAAFEFNFITSATSEAAFKTEIAAVEAAFRTPRGDLVVTQGSQTLLSLKQSDNTGFDANPTILKQGDIGDTGRSRFYKVRIEFGLPADNVGTNFRRFSTINVEYSPERQRTVTISGTYTANSTDGTTGSYAQYLAQIATYAASVLNGIDATAKFEKIGEPQVERNETDKITNFTVIYKEVIFNQSLGNVDDTGLVDPTLVITIQKVAPGDSLGTSVGVGGGQGGTSAPGINAGTDGTVVSIPPSNPGNTTSGVARPITVTVNYTTGIDYTVIGSLAGMIAKWTGTIKPFIIQQCSTLTGGAIIILEESPNYGDLYANKFSATMMLQSYTSTILSQRITISDSTDEGKTFRKVWSGDPDEYYEYVKGRIRLKTITEEREEVTGLSDANAYVEQLVKSSPIPVGLANPELWSVISRQPKAAVLRKGLDGGSQPFVAECTIETVMRYRKKKSPSTANAGGLGSAGRGSVAT